MLMSLLATFFTFLLIVGGLIVGVCVLGVSLFRKHPDKTGEVGKVAGGMLLDWIRKR